MQLSSSAAVASSKCEFEMPKSSKPCVVSPSLLARVNSIDTTKKVPEEVKLGMSDWTDSDSEKENDDFQPPKKRQKVPASLKGKQRFTEMVSSEQLETISKGFVPKNTEKNMKWAVSTFKQWIVSRNQRSAVGETIDVDILSKPVDKDSGCTELCRVLCLFIVEARKTNGEPYLPKTVAPFLLMKRRARNFRHIYTTCSSSKRVLLQWKSVLPPWWG